MSSHHQKAEKTNSSAQEGSHRGTGHEITEMIHRRLHFQSKSPQPSQLHHHGGDGDDQDAVGLKVISLTGNNTGASMKAGRDEVSDTRVSFSVDGEAVEAYANSNFQAVNNSVVLGGSCTAKDPGIHLDIPIETMEPEWQHEEYMKMKKNDKKEKKKKSDALSEDGGKNKKMHKKKSSSSESSSSSSSSSEDEEKH